MHYEDGTTWYSMTTSPSSSDWPSRPRCGNGEDMGLSYTVMELRCTGTMQEVKMMLEADDDGGGKEGDGKGLRPTDQEVSSPRSEEWQKVEIARTREARCSSHSWR